MITVMHDNDTNNVCIKLNSMITDTECNNVNLMKWLILWHIMIGILFNLKSRMI